jgi:hypothetical protein
VFLSNLTVATELLFRYYHAAACLPTMRAMYIVGGFDGLDTISDMWQYSLDTGLWKSALGESCARSCIHLLVAAAKLSLISVALICLPVLFCYANIASCSSSAVNDFVMNYF